MAKLEKVPFEEALDMTGYGKFNLLSFMLCSSIVTGMSFEIFSVAYLVPASACELQTTSTQQGLMAAMPLFGIIITSHFWGYMADTRGRKKILCIMMVLAFVTGATAALSPNWIFFCGCKFLSSSFVGGAFALSLTLLSESTPIAYRYKLLVLTSTVFLACNGIMAVITMPVLPLSFSYDVPLLGIKFNSWRVLNLIFIIPCAISSVGLFYSYESPKYFLSVGREREALKVLSSYFAINNNKSPEEYPVNSIYLDEDQVKPSSTSFWSSMTSQTLPLFKPPLLKKFILLSSLFFIAYVCYNPYITWLPFIADEFMGSVERGDEDMTFCQRLRNSRNISITQEDTNNTCALNTFAMTGVLFIGVFLAIANAGMSYLINLVGRKRLLITIQVVSGVSGLLVNATSSWILSSICFLIFLTGILSFGLLSTFAVDVFPTYVKAMAVCLTLMVGRASAIIGINILKYLLEQHCDLSFYIFGSLAVFGGMVALLMAPERKPS